VKPAGRDPKDESLSHAIPIAGNGLIRESFSGPAHHYERHHEVEGKVRAQRRDERSVLEDGRRT
jgi:hypothetical protein